MMITVMVMVVVVVVMVCVCETNRLKALQALTGMLCVLVLSPPSQLVTGHRSSDKRRQMR